MISTMLKLIGVKLTEEQEKKLKSLEEFCENSGSDIATNTAKKEAHGP